MKRCFSLLTAAAAAVLLLTGCEQPCAHTYTSEQVSAPTCTEPGMMAFSCTVCGDSYTLEVPATGEHSWNEGEVLTPATCGTEGKVQYACLVCETRWEETVPAAGEHAWGQAEIVKAATCGAEGEIAATCTVCGTEMKTVLAKLTAHTFGEPTVTKNATCAVEGEMTAVCGVCGEKQITPTAKTDTHTWDAGKVTKTATCAAEGEKTFRCTVCGAEKKQSVAKTAAHTWKSAGVKTPATCQKEGTEALTCTLCGTAGTRPIPKTDTHVWDAGRVTKSATCAAEGVKTYTCTRCSGVKTETLPKQSEHSWVEKITKAPTTAAEGEKTTSCSVCGTVKGKTSVPKLTVADGENNPYHVRTSYRWDAYLEYKLTGDILTVSGVLNESGINSLTVSCMTEDDGAPLNGTVSIRTRPGFKFESPETYTNAMLRHIAEAEISASAGQSFSVTLDLSGVEDMAFVCVTPEKVTPQMTATPITRDVYVERVDGILRFDDTRFLDHNTEIMKQQLDPALYVKDTTKEIAQLAEKIAGGEKDDLQKMYQLYKWVSENVYSDTRTGAQTDAVTAYNTLRGTSSAYTSLLIDLLRAQGIPAIRTGVHHAAAYTLGSSDSNIRDVNYNVVEAWLEKENRWVIMNPTTASQNKMSNGSQVKKDMDDAYFDLSLWEFSKSYKILERPRGW